MINSSQGFQAFILKLCTAIKSILKMHVFCTQKQGHQNDFDIGEACLKSAYGASVKGESTRGGGPLWLGGWGASPEKKMNFMTPVDAF